MEKSTEGWATRPSVFSKGMSTMSLVKAPRSVGFSLFEQGVGLINVNGRRYVNSEPALPSQLEAATQTFQWLPMGEEAFAFNRVVTWKKKSTVECPPLRATPV